MNQIDMQQDKEEICKLKSVVERSIVKAHIDFAKKSSSPVAIICFSLNSTSDSKEEHELESSLIHMEKINNYAPIYECKSGIFFTFIKNIQLHHGVHLLKEFSQSIEKEFEVILSCGAVTIVDKNDTSDLLMERVSRYMQQALEVNDGKICYGTSQYDFYTKKDEEDILKNFFISSSYAKLYNFYNGIPLSEDVQIISYSKGMLRIKVSFGKATFLKQEPFTFLRHELLPDTLKADIVNTFPQEGTAILTNLRFVEKSPIDRENIRVKPDVPIDVKIIREKNPDIDGIIQSISVNTVSIKLNKTDISDSYFEDNNARFTLVFKLPASKGKMINFKIFALYLTKNSDQIIFSIYMNKFFKQKIENYIELQQTKLKTIVQKMVLDYYQK